MSAVPQFPRGKCWIVIGPRGSGKSIFAEHQLMGTPHAIVIDTKRDFEFADPASRYHLVSYSLEDVRKKLEWISRQERGTHFYGAPVVFKVPGTGAVQRAQADQVARMAMQRGHTQLYYDELAQAVSWSRYEVESPYFQSSVQQGRSIGVGVGSSTQRIQRIALIAGTEADYRVTFYLRHPADRKIAEEIVGGEVPWTALGRNKHSFVIGTDDDGDSELEPHRLILP